MWHVVNMDGYISGPYSKIVDAKNYITSLCDDSRKHPIFKRDNIGQYMYVPKYDPNRSHIPSFYIVNDDRLEDWDCAVIDYMIRNTTYGCQVCGCKLDIDDMMKCKEHEGK
jgi:hypothetical protein